MYPHKNIRLAKTDYVGNNRYFLTICCAGRNRYFSKKEDCEWLVTTLKEMATLRSFAVHAYCVMPDHVHTLVQGLIASSDMLLFMKALKIRTSREFAQKRGVELWQKKYYDHILREKESTESVAWYIWMNPVRAGLVVKPTDYPFVGSLTMNIPDVTIASENWAPPCRADKRPPQKAAATAKQGSYGER